METSIWVELAKIFAGILAGFLSLFVQNLLPLFITVTEVDE